MFVPNIFLFPDSARDQRNPTISTDTLQDRTSSESEYIIKTFICMALKFSSFDLSLKQVFIAELRL